MNIPDISVLDLMDIVTHRSIYRLIVQLVSSSSSSSSITIVIVVGHVLSIQLSRTLGNNFFSFDLFQICASVRKSAGRENDLLAIGTNNAVRFDVFFCSVIQTFKHLAI